MCLAHQYCVLLTAVLVQLLQLALVDVSMYIVDVHAYVYQPHKLLLVVLYRSVRPVLYMHDAEHGRTRPCSAACYCR